MLTKFRLVAAEKCTQNSQVTQTIKRPNTSNTPYITKADE